MKTNGQFQELKALLRRLENLNPDLSVAERTHLFELAAQVGESGFDWCVKQFECLLALYQNSPVKHYGEATLLEYFDELDRNAKLLAAAGEIKPLPASAEKTPRPLSSALVPYSGQAFSLLDRCKLLNRAEISQPLTRAVDAFRRRLEVVDTVLELALQVIWIQSPERTEKWLLRYLKANDGNQDPDVIRDILRVVSSSPSLSREFLGWAEIWAADEALQEYWPNVTTGSDKLLCVYALRCWRRKCAVRNGLLAHLHLLVGQDSLGDEALMKWLSNALENLGECVQRFMALENEKESQDRQWLQTALYLELNRMCSLYRPVLIVADQLLRQPDGANRLAMAFLGLVGKGFEDWEERVRKMAEKIIVRSFLYGLKTGRSPVDTIRKLTFGDQASFNFACSQLDLISQQFDSLKQRDRVVAFLGTFYASYRRPQLLSVEVGKRYRNMMRMLHDDYINNILSAEQQQKIQQNGVLREISGMIAAARHFLDHRRALQTSLEEMIASEMEFVREARTRRLAVIREMLD
jgi:chorismate mutase